MRKKKTPRMLKLIDNSIERKWPPARFSAFLRCPQGVTGDLTRPWAVGPTNLRFLKVERREKREERREKREEITKKAARDPQID